ncbi:hypothetical protein EV586_102746 [Tumebacillus sp. BK434]|uniref:DUF6886 family protein n=1 Tax=Tumebacillus sp. BK434 TaxID=2512169 RepID=UPI0010E9CB1C|nr:DUF6886 family protein [Tumebacillus sp. BK434]TCP58292.1 hypothetical protein EV586_102746 [Tumebacillus sp. BK434]
MMYHFSEDPSIRHFEPRLHPSHPDKPAMVWAIDEARAPMYFFPRDCPRVAFWAKPDTTADDQERFLAHTAARMVIAVESRWWQALQNTDLYVYHLPDETFTCIDEGAGYFTSLEAVTPLSVEPVGDLLARLGAANVELRLTPSLYPLHDALKETSLHFSMIRMRNAIREEEELRRCSTKA